MMRIWLRRLKQKLRRHAVAVVLQKKVETENPSIEAPSTEEPSEEGKTE